MGEGEEAATADVAADFTDCVMNYFVADTDTEDAHAVVHRGTDEANGAIRFRRRRSRFGHAGLDLVSSATVVPIIP